MLKRLCAAVSVVALLAVSAQAGVETGLKKGTPDIKSAGPLAFGPNGVLFVGDSQGAAVFAIGTEEAGGNAAAASPNVEGIDAKIAGLLGTTAREVQVNDLAVNPATGSVYLSVSRGRGPQATPVIVRVDGKSKLSVVSLKDVPFAKAELPNAPDPKEVDRRNQSKRAESITDLSYNDGKVFVAGLSNEEFESTLRAIPFPFEKAGKGTGVKIFHGAHGKFETASPVRTFTHLTIDDKPHLVAAYTCTPLVKFPVEELEDGGRLEGTTVAELGNRNRPLDIFAYTKDGKEYLLMANSARGVMKIPTADIGKIEGITDRVADKAGLQYETVSDLEGIEQLDRLNETSAVVLQRGEDGKANLRTIDLP